MSLKPKMLVIAALLLGACANQSAQVSTTGEPDADRESRATTSTSTSSTLAPTTSTTGSLDPRVVESARTAEEFMTAFAARDMDGVEATAVEGHVFGILVNQFSLFEREFAWRDAVGWDMTVTGCDVENDDIDNLQFVCSLNHETDWSRALGVGPYESEFFVSVCYPDTDCWIYPEADAPTVTTRAFAQFPTFFFKSETWTPFLTWLEENHAEDLTTMFGTLTFAEVGLLPGEPMPALSDESIVLWEEHTLGFSEATASR